jgi:hypothetical protein
MVILLIDKKIDSSALIENSMSEATNSDPKESESSEWLRTLRTPS